MRKMKGNWVKASLIAIKKLRLSLSLLEKLKLDLETKSTSSQHVSTWKKQFYLQSAYCYASSSSKQVWSKCNRKKSIHNPCMTMSWWIQKKLEEYRCAKKDSLLLLLVVVVREVGWLVLCKWLLSGRVFRSWLNREEMYKMAFSFVVATSSIKFRFPVSTQRERERGVETFNDFFCDVCERICFTRMMMIFIGRVVLLQIFFLSRCHRHVLLTNIFFSLSADITGIIVFRKLTKKITIAR